MLFVAGWGRRPPLILTERVGRPRPQRLLACKSRTRCLPLRERPLKTPHCSRFITPPAPCATLDQSLNISVHGLLPRHLEGCAPGCPSLLRSLPPRPRPHSRLPCSCGSAETPLRQVPPLPLPRSTPFLTDSGATQRCRLSLIKPSSCKDPEACSGLESLLRHWDCGTIQVPPHPAGLASGTL